MVSIHSSSYSGGKQKSDRQIYYSVIGITNGVHNKAGRPLKTKYCRALLVRTAAFQRVAFGGLGAC